jgi:hypothetical protein
MTAERGLITAHNLADALNLSVETIWSIPVMKQNEV